MTAGGCGESKKRGSGAAEWVVGPGGGSTVAFSHARHWPCLFVFDPSPFFLQGSVQDSGGGGLTPGRPLCRHGVRRGRGQETSIGLVGSGFEKERERGLIFFLVCIYVDGVTICADRASYGSSYFTYCVRASLFEQVNRQAWLLAPR